MDIIRIDAGGEMTWTTTGPTASPPTILGYVATITLDGEDDPLMPSFVIELPPCNNSKRRREAKALLHAQRKGA